MFSPTKCDLELASQRRCDAGGGSDERARQWRAAAEQGDLGEIRRLAATGPPPVTTATASSAGGAATETLTFDLRWPSPLSYVKDSTVFARKEEETDEGACWRRGIVSRVETDGRAQVTFKDGIKSAGSLPTSTLRLDVRSEDCGVSALMVAAVRADAGMVAALLEHAHAAAAVRACTSRHGCRPLHFAAMEATRWSSAHCRSSAEMILRVWTATTRCGWRRNSAT